MLRNVLCGMLLITSPAWAALHYLPRANTEFPFTLPPKDPQVFANQFYWTITAHCTIHSDNPENHIGVKFLRKTGQVNDIKLTVGDALELTLVDNAQISIVSPPGSKVELTNNEALPVDAVCLVG